MKTFIYLPLIALIVLTGCKSNSFTTQRYTKYGHASHKKSQQEVIVVKEKDQPKKAVETEIVRSSETRETPIELITSGISNLKGSIIKHDRKVYSLSANAEKMDVPEESFSKDESISNESSTPVIKTQKTFKEKAHNARGLIGDAFETAVWIVLVVIFVILIIFLLSVIF
ncbi:MAG: hypothetical protein ABIP51_02845 [Bacteroidia bacterium]